MRIEDRITQSLTGLDHLDTTPPGVGDVVAQGTSIKRRRMIRTVAVAVVAVLAIAGGIALPRLGEDAVEPAPPTIGEWEQLAPTPEAMGDMSLSATHWTGEELLVIGQDSAAAYDPATDTWRDLADPPFDWVGAWAAEGDTVVVHDGRVQPNTTPENVRGVWWVYDAGPDRWQEWDGNRWSVKAGSDIDLHEDTIFSVFHDPRLGDVVQTFDDGHKRHTLPVSRDKHPIDARSVVATDQEVFVSGHEAEDPAPSDGDAPLVVERWDGESWTRFDPSPLPAFPFRHWTGERLVSLGVTDSVRLDPDTGRWSVGPSLPEIDPFTYDGWPVGGGSGEGTLLIGRGGIYDDATGRWTELRRPAGAAADSYMAGIIGDGALYVIGGVDERDVPVNELWRLALG